MKDRAVGALRHWQRVRELSQRVRSLEVALDRLPPTSSERFTLLTNLGNRWRDKYLCTGLRADIEASIGCYRQALSAAPGAEAASFVRSNLAAALTDFYGLTSELEHLEAAIDNGRTAIRDAKPGALEQVRALGNLSHALHERYLRTRHVPDLDETIRMAEDALKLAPSGSPEQLMCKVNLAVGLLERRDIDRATEILESVATSLQVGSAEHNRVMMALNGARVLAANVTDNGSSIDQKRSIDELRRIVARLPAGSADKHMALFNLGKALWRNYQHEKDPEQLEAAIEALNGAVLAAPDGAGELPMYLNDLGIALSERSFISDSAQGLAAAIAVWVRALLLLDEKFGTVSLDYKLGQQSVSVALGISERLISGYLGLGEMMDASGRDRMVRNALLVAERSKTKLVTELIGRAELPAPPDVPADQPARERVLITDLRALDITELGAHGQIDKLAQPVAPGRTARRAQLRQELEQLWSAMAKTSATASDYVALRRGHPVTWDHLFGLAKNLGSQTALASIFMTNSRTLMFVVRSTQDAPSVSQIEIGADGWRDVLQRFYQEVRLDSGKAETWDVPLRPLFRNAAQYLRGVERVVLAPQGWGLQLPWSIIAQRSGWRSADGGTMPLVTVESLGLLRRLLDRPRSSQSGALVVGNPSGDLEKAESEALQIAALFGVSPLLGPSATKAAVLQNLRTASVVHFAAHAEFSRSSPLDSGVVLADGVLTAREILAESIQLDLLVLSACDTGRAESLGGYELAGLSQAFLVAGVRCLVASLWEVDDSPTAALMRAFYEHWRAGADLSRALRNAAACGSDGTGSASVTLWNAFVLSGDWSAKWPNATTAES